MKNEMGSLIFKQTAANLGQPLTEFSLVLTPANALILILILILILNSHS
jgi:hypothetical protein